MAIQSSAFGSVTLTREDAEKFQRQVTYGRPKTVAVDAVKRGVDIAQQFREGRSLDFKRP